MSVHDAIDSLLDYAEERGRRKRRAEREARGEHEWWDDEWRVERAQREGIRFSDEELRAIWQSGNPPPLSFNEARRAAKLGATPPALDVERLAGAMFEALSDQGVVRIDADSLKELDDIAAAVLARLAERSKEPQP